MKKRYVLIGILSLINFSPIFAQKLKIYTIEEPPLNFVEGNKITGVTTDIVREILKRTNNTSTISTLPWARAYQYAKTQENTIIFSIGRIPQRENMFKWVGPIARKKAMLFAKRGSGIKVEKLKNAKDVRTILTMRKDTQEQYLQKHSFTNIHGLATWRQGLKMLLSNRGDLWTQKDLDVAIILKEEKVNSDRIEAVFTMFELSAYIGVSKSTNDDIVRIWQSTLDEIKNDGTFEKIIRKWEKYYGVSNWIYKDGLLMVDY